MSKLKFRHTHGMNMTVVWTKSEFRPTCTWEEVMSAITIELSPKNYQTLAEHARNMGKDIEVLSRELLEEALPSPATERPKTVREVFRQPCFA